MTWIGIVLWILMHAGDLIGLIKQILDLIHSIPKDQALSIKDKIAAAIQTGDKEQVKQVLLDQKKHCEGIACAPQLVGG